MNSLFSRGRKWRSSAWYITLVVASGTAMEAFTYIIVPIMPYRLPELGYSSPADIAKLTSWLFVAYSAGILLFSIPFGCIFAAYSWRRAPLILANLVVIAALLGGMLVKSYGFLVFTRFILGAASTVIWTVGLALICENVPEKNIGRQIGWAIAGVSIGSTLAAPISGALYARFGWYAPHIFSIAGVGLDLIARLLVVEGRVQETLPADLEMDNPVEPLPHLSVARPLDATNLQPKADVDLSVCASSPEAVYSASANRESNGVEPSSLVKNNIALWRILIDMAKCPRGASGFAMTFVFGLTLGMQDSTLTLHVQTAWHKGPSWIGIIYPAPTFVTGPLAGHIADIYGAEWVIGPGLLLTLPFFALLIPQAGMAFFIVMFTMQNALLSTGIGPIGVEFAAAAKGMAHKGATEIHEFAAMNFVFAGSSLIGALVGGEVYASTQKGWAAICWILFTIALLSIPIPLICAGERPMISRLKAKLAGINGARNTEGPEMDTGTGEGVVTTHCRPAIVDIVQTQE